MEIFPDPCKEYPGLHSSSLIVSSFHPCSPPVYQLQKGKKYVCGVFKENNLDEKKQGLLYFTQSAVI